MNRSAAGHRPTQDLPMPPVDPIEDPDRRHRPAEWKRTFGYAAEDDHLKGNDLLRLDFIERGRLIDAEGAHPSPSKPMEVAAAI